MSDTQPTLKTLESCKVSPRKELAMPAEVPTKVAATSVTKRAGMGPATKGYGSKDK